VAVQFDKGVWDANLYALIQDQRVFSAAFRLAPTGLLGANALVFNPTLQNRVIWVYQIRLTASVALDVDLFLINADPAEGGALSPVCGDLSDAEAQAVTESAVVATPPTHGTIHSLELSNNFGEFVWENNPRELRPNTGIMVSCNAVAGKFAGSISWLEIPERE